MAPRGLENVSPSSHTKAVREAKWRGGHAEEFFPSARAARFAPHQWTHSTQTETDSAEETRLSALTPQDIRHEENAGSILKFVEVYRVLNFLYFIHDW
jgi:hypothetical protein